MAALQSLLNVICTYPVLQVFTQTERTELKELQRKLILNISVNVLSNVLFCLDINFKEKLFKTKSRH